MKNTLHYNLKLILLLRVLLQYLHLEICFKNLHMYLLFILYYTVQIKHPTAWDQVLALCANLRHLCILFWHAFVTDRYQYIKDWKVEICRGGLSTVDAERINSQHRGDQHC